MVFNSITQMTKFFNSSQATFNYAVREGLLKQDKITGCIDSKNPENWDYLYKWALKKGTDIKYFFGDEFSVSKLKQTKSLKNKLPRYAKDKDGYEVEVSRRVRPKEKKEYKNKELASLQDYTSRKAKAEALLKEEILKTQIIKNKKLMGGLIDKQIVMSVFEDMLSTLDQVILGSAGKGIGERINQKSIETNNQTLRERVTSFNSLYTEIIQGSLSEFKQLYFKKLQRIEDDFTNE